MANFMHNLLDFLNLSEDEDDFEDDFEPVKETKKGLSKASEKKEDSTPAPRRYDTVAKTSRMASMSRPSYEEDEDYESPRRERIQRMERQQSYNSNRITPMRHSNHGLEVCIIKPERFEDSQEICDMLKNERAVIVNLEGLDLALAQRIVDFVSGSIYALNAKIHQISGSIFCVSPEKVDISGDYIDMISQNGFEVPNLKKD